jgi:hypothetical protein
MFTHNRTISSINVPVALAIGGAEIFNQIKRFSEAAKANEYTCFTHYHFFYSYPKWGKQWPSQKSCEYHTVNTKCHFCNWQPKRNYAGVGSIYLLNNGISNNNVLIPSIGGKQKSRMIFLCPTHVEPYYKWIDKNKIPKKGFVQLELF